MTAEIEDWVWRNRQQPTIFMSCRRVEFYKSVDASYNQGKIKRGNWWIMHVESITVLGTSNFYKKVYYGKWKYSNTLSY